MNNQPIYVKFNSYRKPKFALATEIVDLNGKYVVHKYAANEESKEFLEQLKTIHDLLVKSNLPFKINSIKIVDKNKLEFEYIEGVTLLHELELCAKNGSKEDCIRIYTEFSKLLDQLPFKNEYLSEDFKKVFGKTGRDEKYDVIIPGILDLNLDNIIRTNDKEPTLIDYEWTFGFGIPKRYVLYRAIYNTYIALGNTLSKIVDIEDIEKELSFTKEEIAKCLNWEVSFQKYVIGYENDITILQKTKGDTEVKSFPIERKRELETEKTQLERDKNILNKEKVVLQKSIQLLEEEKNALVPDALEFREFKQTKIWKGLTMYRKIKKYTKRFLKYIIAIPRLLKKFPLKEFPLRIYVAIRHMKYNEYNRDYQIYLRQNKIDKKYYKEAKEEIDTFEKQPLISIIVPVYNVDLKWIKKAVQSIKEQIYTNWELCLADDASTNTKLVEYLKEISKDPKIKVVFREKNGHISEASNSAIEIAKGEFLALMDNDDVIHPQALYKIVKAINENPTVGLIYSDEDKMELNGTRCDPIFKFDYSPDYLLSTNYFCHLTAIRKDLVDKVGGFRKGYEGSQDYDLFLRIVELIKEKDIVHIPDVLYSWRKIPGSTALTYDQKGYAQKASFKALEDTIERRKIDGVVSEGLQGGFFRIKYNIKNDPLISIVVVSENNSKNLKESINSILEKTDYKNYEIVLVSKDIKDSISNQKVHSYPFDKKYNISEMRNYGVTKSNGEYIVILDENTKIIDSDWLEGLLEHAQRDDVGAVGPKVLTPDKEVFSTSFSIDEEGKIKNIHRSLPPHMQVRANLVANYTIISDICFMISKEKYEKLWEQVKRKDIAKWTDIFLKSKPQGLYNVYTPYPRIEYTKRPKTKEKIN
ncbi:MAG: glycosyltransferase [Candidatus Dojkabacteria bacterium]